MPDRLQMRLPVFWQWCLCSGNSEVCPLEAVHTVQRNNAGKVLLYGSYCSRVTIPRGVLASLL